MPADIVAEQGGLVNRIRVLTPPQQAELFLEPHQEIALFAFEQGAARRPAYPEAKRSRIAEIDDFDRPPAGGVPDLTAMIENLVSTAGRPKRASVTWQLRRRRGFCRGRSLPP